MLSHPSLKLLKAIFLAIGFMALVTLPEPTKAQLVDEKIVISSP